MRVIGEDDITDPGLAKHPFAASRSWYAIWPKEELNHFARKFGTRSQERRMALKFSLGAGSLLVGYVQAD